MPMMIRFALLAALLSGSAAPAQAGDPAAEDQKVEGRWLVAHRYYTPSETTAAVGKLLTDLGNEVEIKNGKLSACDPKKSGLYVLVDFHPRTTPKFVNLKVPGKKDQILVGIYRLEGDVLTLAVGTGAKRPKTFMNPENQVQLALKRAPKKAPDSAGPATR